MLNILAQLGVETIAPPGVVLGLWVAREIVGRRRNRNGVHKAIADHEVSCPVKDSIGQIQKDIREIRQYIFDKKGGG